VESKATGERVLYTGDFKSRPSPVNEPLEPVPCDTLVMEATYGRPQYVFPPQEQVLDTACRTLEHWLSRGERPVVLGWRLGKSQEVMHHLLAQGFDVAAEQSVHRVAERYQQAGVEFPGAFVPFDGQWREGQVLVAPPGAKTTHLLGETRGLRFMELTGWAVNGRRPWGRRGDADLPFSDHADFNELVEYVRRVNPKQVYTVNGFPELASHLRTLGYPAVHLDCRGKAAEVGTQMRMM
jgi:DNA ligase-1